MPPSCPTIDCHGSSQKRSHLDCLSPLLNHLSPSPELSVTSPRSCARCKWRKKKCLYSPHSLVCNDCKAANLAHECVPNEHQPVHAASAVTLPSAPDSQSDPTPHTKPSITQRPGHPSRKAKHDAEPSPGSLRFLRLTLKVLALVSRLQVILVAVLVLTTNLFYRFSW